MIRKSLSILPLLIAFIGCNGFLIAWVQANASECSTQLHISDVQGIIVTESGIYIGLGYYSRIQKYDLHDSYIDCWETDTDSKEFEFII
ncbi:hypothetical protein Oweho_1117 [Owenweeksia hongkongensis DSM 17368]|uniref:Uncharacterized protein n=1 Tax=Owenweeksia hongkongensis (strain DSM 17368 / CIP 108786 / JCM 12287 / NRRL B-23963 / UST20020801) TaxID=926562 RepID=G8R578_OWEHD|nr:hypothetical protein [Owenweeksia hongkongensis]AEV32123.1 hypothetical protein Oweho_1117 [Owenweeksia hongkongensis DSM 17368]